ncbi:MAG: gfo/Idh/MocA family oxidoreductase, partial [Isosphaeraceae bacterium]
TTVQAEGPPIHPETAPSWMIVQWTYPERGEKPPVKLTWYDGGKRPDLPDAHRKGWGDAVLFVGEKGNLLSDYSRHQLLPEDTFKDFEPPPKSIPSSIGHHQEWLQACRTGGPTTCNFDYSGALSEAVLLGNVAYRTGKPLTWDAENLKAVGCPEADEYIHREYRKGWSLV